MIEDTEHITDAADLVGADTISEPKSPHPAESVLARIEADFVKFYDDLKQRLADVRSHL